MDESSSVSQQQITYLQAIAAASQPGSQQRFAQLMNVWDDDEDLVGINGVHGKAGDRWGFLMMNGMKPKQAAFHVYLEFQNHFDKKSMSVPLEFSPFELKSTLPPALGPAKGADPSEPAKKACKRACCRTREYPDEKLFRDPDQIVVGMGVAGMISMLFAVAHGKRVVGVDIRGAPFLGVHWNCREDVWHQLKRIDDLMSARFPPELIPKREVDGEPFLLHELFFSPNRGGSDIIGSLILSGTDTDHHLVGSIHNVEFIDDRYKNGKPNREILRFPPPKPAESADASRVRDNATCLASPSTFQISAKDLMDLLRTYLQAIEKNG